MEIKEWITKHKIASGIIGFIVFCMIIGIFIPTDCNCEECEECEDCNDCPKTYEKEYNECSYKLEDVTYNWINYVDALHEYCVLDPYNNLCIANQYVFDMYGY